MAKTIVVVGFGPGVSTAVAERFGAAGFAVALVARTPDRLARGVEALAAKGVKAAAFPADAGDPAAITAAVAAARAALGPIHAIHWNAYSNTHQDLLETDPASLMQVFDVAVGGLLAAVQAALPDLKAAEDAAVLVTNGAFGETAPQMDAFANHFKSGGLGLANAAKHKLVGLLADRLRGDGIFVGEVMIAGAVKGTAFSADTGLEASTVADAFWRLFQGRGEVRARVA